jgi:hypothetical protein
LAEAEGKKYIEPVQEEMPEFDFLLSEQVPIFTDEI